ncbi:MAG: HU family DNA-binding protein [Pseudorhodobacter sp.]|nr:HU family DNA-binding protein [Pseudorhodobacter sp.]
MTTAKTAPAKPDTAKPKARKPAAKPVTAEGSAVSAASLTVVADLPVTDASSAVLKMKELVDQVVKATGAKKKDVKPIIEATLASLGAALSHGDDLNLLPLGKAKVGRQVDLAIGELIVVKLRRGGARGADKSKAKEALAEADD